MHDDCPDERIAVFDIGGTWFRWGIYEPTGDLVESQRSPAINYLSHPALSALDLQQALVDFILRHATALRDRYRLRCIGISLGAPINAHDMTVLGSGPLWGPTARPFNLHARLHEAAPDLEWHVVNDVTALLARYMENDAPCKKTLLITVSSGIGCRLYDHVSRRIPYDPAYGVQGEIGHLVTPFELDGKLVKRRCECGGWNHMNAFSSGRGIGETLRSLPALSPSYRTLFADSADSWQHAGDDYRLNAFRAQLDQGNSAAGELLTAFVTPLVRALAGAFSLDPEIDRIVITGGVAHGLGVHYREALLRTFMRDGLYQITERDPNYLARRLHWEDAEDFAGLRGAGMYVARLAHMRR